MAKSSIKHYLLTPIRRILTLENSNKFNKTLPSNTYSMYSDTRNGNKFKKTLLSNTYSTYSDTRNGNKFKKTLLSNTYSTYFDTRNSYKFNKHYPLTPIRRIQQIIKEKEKEKQHEFWSKDAVDDSYSYLTASGNTRCRNCNCLTHGDNHIDRQGKCMESKEQSNGIDDNSQEEAEVLEVYATDADVIHFEENILGQQFETR